MQASYKSDKNHYPDLTTPSPESKQSMIIRLQWLIIPILLTIHTRLSHAGSRNSATSPVMSFDSAFPEHLRGPGFTSCDSVLDEGQRGVCKILAAMDSQLQTINTTSFPQNRKSSENFSHSCNFKQDNGKSLHRYASEISSSLRSLLDRYSQMHRACSQVEHVNLKELYQKKSKLRCRYIVWRCTFGLGNKIMSLTSAFLYAILSQRVLLLDEPQSWDQLFCEPFPGSSWRLPQGMTLLKNDPSIGFGKFYSLCTRNATSSACSRTFMAHITFSQDSKPEDHRFLVCPSAFSSVRNIPILNFDNSNQYFASGFFLNPVLQPVLQTIFPERRMFNNLAGFLLNPSDRVWGSIRELYIHNFQNASTRIGVQIRESKGKYREYYDRTVPNCIRSNSGMCPIEIDEFQESGSGKLSESYYSVYVSSLVGGHAVKINSSLRTLERETGQRFELASQAADGEQRDDVAHQKKALADMWMLSLADVLMTSHMSTFGYTAQGLGGVTPYLLKPWPENPCWLGLSSEPCFHFSPSRASLSCKQDGGLKVVLADSLFKPCPDFSKTGIQLLEA